MWRMRSPRSTSSFCSRALQFARTQSSWCSTVACRSVTKCGFNGVEADLVCRTYDTAFDTSASLVPCALGVRPNSVATTTSVSSNMTRCFTSFSKSATGLSTWAHLSYVLCGGRCAHPTYRPPPFWPLNCTKPTPVSVEKRTPSGSAVCARNANSYELFRVREL